MTVDSIYSDSSDIRDSTGSSDRSDRSGEVGGKLQNAITCQFRVKAGRYLIRRNAFELIRLKQYMKTRHSSFDAVGNVIYLSSQSTNYIILKPC